MIMKKEDSRMRTLCDWTRWVIIFAMSPLSVSDGFASDRCCAHCGCHERVAKVCRLVREERKITAICWGVEEEDFCVNGPSCAGCVHCETICKKDSADKKDAQVCSESKALTWTNWLPSSNATIYTKKKLVKKSVTKSVPSFRWVVEDLCERCKVETRNTQSTVESSEAKSKQ